MATCPKLSREFESDLLDALLAEIHLVDFANSHQAGDGVESEDFTASAVSPAFCARIDATIKVAETLEEFVCGNGSSSSFCVRLRQIMAAAKMLRDMFCESPVTGSEVVAAAGASC